jgi:hypothetical protein
LFDEELALVPISATFGDTLGPFKIEQYNAGDVFHAFSEIEGVKLTAEGGTEEWND